ncbi:MAG: chaperone modulator CbpM [Flavobacteriaceae bacterium]|nr:chaperone modulator CbpM [Flavobacteriaceae bacterium]
MSKENFIPLHKLCELYQVEMSFFSNLSEVGLIQITTIEQSLYVDQDKINDIEKMIRIYHDLNLNIEGIDIVFNLLQKITDLENELITIKNRLRFYEN